MTRNEMVAELRAVQERLAAIADVLEDMEAFADAHRLNDGLAYVRAVRETLEEAARHELR